MFSLLRTIFKGIDGAFGKNAKGIKTETTVTLYLMLDSIRNFACVSASFCMSDGTYDIIQGLVGWLVVVFLGARLKRTNEKATSESEV